MGECFVGSQLSVFVEIVVRIIGGCDEGNVEGVYESVGLEIWLGDFFSDGVVDVVSVFRVGLFGDVKNVDKLVNELIMYCCVSKIMLVFVQDLEGFLVVFFVYCFVFNIQVFKIDVISMQQLIYVVVGGNEQVCWVRESYIVGDL